MRRLHAASTLVPGGHIAGSLLQASGYAHSPPTTLPPPPTDRQLRTAAGGSPQNPVRGDVPPAFQVLCGPDLLLRTPCRHPAVPSACQGHAVLLALECSLRLRLSARAGKRDSVICPVHGQPLVCSTLLLQRSLGCVMDALLSPECPHVPGVLNGHLTLCLVSWHRAR